MPRYIVRFKTEATPADRQSITDAIEADGGHIHEQQADSTGYEATFSAPTILNDLPGSDMIESVDQD
ncbi:subtilase [Pseudohyphozyma bogoriensis]|nr:subtilase [Pseudohyphozyma bogoriensis]